MNRYRFQRRLGNDFLTVFQNDGFRRRRTNIDSESIHDGHLFSQKSILKRIGIAAINGRNGLDVFDEDAGVRAGTAEVDNDVVCALNGFLFQHAARLLAFHDLPYLFDVVDFKGDVAMPPRPPLNLVRTPECGMIISIGLA